MQRSATKKWWVCDRCLQEDHGHEFPKKWGSVKVYPNPPGSGFEHLCEDCFESLLEWMGLKK